MGTLRAILVGLVLMMMALAGTGAGTALKYSNDETISGSDGSFVS